MTVDLGSGPPVVLVPGIQGRWEWVAPALSELSRHHRVLTFSLGDIPNDDVFGRSTTYIDGLLDRAGEPRAVIVGVSFGGLVAMQYAARRPSRVSHLVLVSAPSPRWKLDARTARYVKHARLVLPLFALRAARRLLPEVAVALPAWRSRASFITRHVYRVLRSPLSPRRMAAWVRAWMAANLAEECAAIQTPTLLITGEPRLDHVVPVASSLEYLDLIAGARHTVLAGTGHIGLLLKPVEFATLVTNFVSPGDIEADARTPSRDWRLGVEQGGLPESSRA